MLAGKLLAEAASAYDGKNVVQTQSYGPEARGGKSKSDVVISDGEIDYPKATTVDVLLAMTQAALDEYGSSLRDGGILLVDSYLVERVETPGAIRIPFTMLAIEHCGRKLFANVVALGALTEATRVVTWDAHQARGAGARAEGHGGGQREGARGRQGRGEAGRRGPAWIGRFSSSSPTRFARASRARSSPLSSTRDSRSSGSPRVGSRATRPRASTTSTRGSTSSRVWSSILSVRRERRRPARGGGRDRVAQTPRGRDRPGRRGARDDPRAVRQGQEHERRARLGLPRESRLRVRGLLRRLPSSDHTIARTSTTGGPMAAPPETETDDV